MHKRNTMLVRTTKHEQSFTLIRETSRRFVLALGLMFAAACVTSTDAGPSGVPVQGRWAYAASQSSPSPAEAIGALTFSSQSGSSVGGSLDVIETDVRGLQRRLAGPVTGRTVDSTTLDFDAVVDGMSRRHVGVIRKDSIIGSWIEMPTSGGAISASGTFRAKRAP